MRVSVCMATYNGQSHLGEQLDSILSELEEGDEVVVVDDASTDGTVALLQAYEDPRIRLHVRKLNRGYVATFEEAMRLAEGDVLLLSDQDDVWIPGRRRVLTDAVQTDRVAASNLVLLGSGDPLPSPLRRRPWRLHEERSGQRVRNELRILAGIAPYFGCAMAVRRDAVDSILPFPSFLTESHDLWIATVANQKRWLRHVSEPTIRRRVHENNTSPSRPRGLPAVVRARIMLLRAWWAARAR